MSRTKRFSKASQIEFKPVLRQDGVYDMAETAVDKLDELVIGNNIALWEKRIYADLDVFVGSEEEHFAAHRAIVCLHSDFFGACCSGEWLEATSQKLDIPDAKPDVFEAALRFLYLGALPNTNDKDYRWWADLILLADMLLIPQLVKQCKNDFLSWMKSWNGTKEVVNAKLEFLNWLLLELPDSDSYLEFVRELTCLFVKSLMDSGVEQRKMLRTELARLKSTLAVELVIFITEFILDSFVP